MWCKTLGSGKLGWKTTLFWKERHLLYSWTSTSQFWRTKEGIIFSYLSVSTADLFFLGREGSRISLRGFVSARTGKASVLHLLEDLNALTSSSWIRWPLGVFPILCFSRKGSFLFLNYFSVGLARALNVLLTRCGCF